VVRIGGNVSGIRYLQCSLCSCEWHVVRAKCSNCDNSKGIAYYYIENDAAGKDAEVVRAESCPECKTYLKVVQMDKDPHAEAGADDLASLSLDLLMGDEGFSRSGFNLLMIHGADEGK
jgi:FdhE protein